MKYFISIFFILTILSNAQAQLTIYPYTAFQHQKASNSLPQAKKAPLTLPFFDDFAGVIIGTPDTNLWLTNGVFVNNTLANNPPSVNTATFDAYNANGQAYDLSSSIATGFSDTLTSQPIDLSGITAGATDVYLSFFWQEQGLGEVPDPEDYIVLQAKDLNGNWVDLWQQNGTATTEEFQKEAIQITDDFFHIDFQFQFIRFGRNSGFFDVFHIDYVYMNNGINTVPDDTFFPDVAYQKQPQHFLSKYTAMPVNQYFLNAGNETNSTFTTTLKNLNNQPRVISNYNFIVRDTISKAELLNIVPDAPPQAPFMEAGDVFELTANSTLSLTPTTSPMVIETKFEIGLAGDIERANDTVRTYTNLTDYFAYDDGTAEYVAGIRQRFGKIAVQYVVNEPAQLTDIDICFVPFERDLSNQTFVLSVWRRVSGRQDEPLFQRSYIVEYPTKQNSFVRFSIDEFENISVADTFYVGIQQTTDDLLAIGFDRNTNAQAYTFQNTQGVWEQDALIVGTLMIRPVFGQDIVSSIKKPTLQDLLTIYPNPTSQKLTFKGATITQVQLYDSRGVLQTDFEWSAQSIDLGKLPEGLYFIHFKDNKGNRAVKKVLKN